MTSKTVPTTLEAYAEHWKKRTRRYLKPRARETYAQNLRLYLIPRLGAETPLAALTRNRIADMLLAMLDEGYHGTTVWLAFKVLRAMLNAARVDDAVIEHNPCERIARILPRREGPKIERAFRREEIHKFLATAEKKAPAAMYAMFVVASRSGLRLGELLGLLWEDVNLEARVMIVRRSLDWQYRETTPKGGITRDMPMSKATVAALVELRETQVSASPFVFCGTRGRPWSRTYIRRVMRKICLAAGIPVRTPHAFRHGFLTQLAENAVNPWTIRDLARHRSITTTEAYLHLNRQHLPVVDALD